MHAHAWGTWPHFKIHVEAEAEVEASQELGEIILHLSRKQVGRETPQLTRPITNAPIDARDLCPPHSPTHGCVKLTMVGENVADGMAGLRSESLVELQCVRARTLQKDEPSWLADCTTAE